MGSFDVALNRPRIPAQQPRVSRATQNTLQRNPAQRAQPRSNHANVRAHRGESSFQAAPAKKTKAPTAPMVQPGGTFEAKGTGYNPTKAQGGANDRLGKPLHTLQDFLDGKSDHVSVAMDSKAFPYGTELNIKELDAKYADQLKKLGKDHIPFKVTDTGGAFTNAGTGAMDICTRSYADAHEDTVNGKLTATVVSTPGLNPMAPVDSFRV